MFQGKVAIVTGASSGIGLSVARKLAQVGGKVALVARTKDKLEALARELGENAAAYPLDVGDLRALAALPARVVERFGALDVVVNNAGLHHRGEIAHLSADALAEMVNVNLTAPIYLSRAALEHLRPGGAIVNVASLAGMVPFPGAATYCATKAGLRAFSRAMGDELRERGIHVGTVSPGPVDTGFFDDLEKVADVTFSQPISTADEVADAVLACIRDKEPEIAVPSASGRLATVAYLFPGFATRLRPLLAKRGAKAKRAYMEKKRRGTGTS
jgi:short-subunit dehydrogenase